MVAPPPGHSTDHARERIENAPVSDLHRCYPDLLGARAAMQWAAEAARKLAEQTGMALVEGEPMREGRPGAGTAIDIYEVIDRAVSNTKCNRVNV